jgi:hypothetical protein
VLDAVLADLVTDADRSRDGVDGEKNEVLPLPDAGDARDGLGPDGIRSDDARPDPVSRPMEMPRVDDGLIGRRTRSVPVSHAVRRELAAVAVGMPGRTTVLRYLTARPVRLAPGAGLAATVTVAGSWGQRARFRDVRGRRDEGSRPK